MLSRGDSATITSAEWVKDPKELDLHWWTIKTDKTGDTTFTIVGVHHNINGELTLSGWDQEHFQVGNTIKLGDLSFVPTAYGIMAYSESPAGPVLATIGRIKDRLEPLCGPLVYLVPRCNTRTDTTNPSDEQMEALRAALPILMKQGITAAVKYLEKTALFESVFESDSTGCPACPGSLPDGVFEWRQ